MITARCTQPLQKMPAAVLSFGVRLHRRTSAAAMHDPQAMLAANQKLVTRLLALGGKVYPPYAPVLTQEQWRQHYGSTIWQRVAAAKKIRSEQRAHAGRGAFLSYALRSF